MQYRVKINGITLRDSPKEIRNLQSSFVRDQDLPGVFVEELVQIVFVGDGYCKLKEYQEDLEFCELSIQFYKICDGEEVLFFDGIGTVSTIEINISEKEASIKITDNTLLNRILVNKDSLYVPTAETAIDGETILPVSTHPMDFYAADASQPAEYLNVEVYEGMELLQGMLNWIVGNRLTVTSEFFNKTVVNNIVPLFASTFNNYIRTYEIVYAVPPIITDTTTITFKNWYGEQFTVTIVGIGTVGTHIENVWTTLLKFGSLTTLADKQQFTFDYDYTTFDLGSDNGTDTIILSSFLPNQILSITSTSGDVSFSLSDDPDHQYIDTGINTCFLTGKMLNKVGSDNFSMSFNDLIEDLNKSYNIQFIIRGGQFRIENKPYFDTNNIVLTFDNVQNLKIAGSLENLYNKISASDKGIQIRSFLRRDFISQYCGVTKSFDVETEAIASFATIWDHLDNPDTDNEDNMYIIQGNTNSNTISESQRTVLVSSEILDDNTFFAYMLNFGLTNNKKIYRHQNKFKGDIALAPFPGITNDNPAELVYEATFEQYITPAQYRNLINNNLSNVKFKTDDSEYYMGITQEVQYSYETGIGQFTVFARKV